MTARSTAEARRLDPTGITVFRQADVGEYLREVGHCAIRLLIAVLRILTNGGFSRRIRFSRRPDAAFGCCIIFAQGKEIKVQSWLWRYGGMGRASVYPALFESFYTENTFVHLLAIFVVSTSGLIHGCPSFKFFNVE